MIKTVQTLWTFCAPFISAIVQWHSRWIGEVCEKLCLIFQGIAFNMHVSIRPRWHPTSNTITPLSVVQAGSQCSFLHNIVFGFIYFIVTPCRMGCFHRNVIKFNERTGLNENDYGTFSLKFRCCLLVKCCLACRCAKDSKCVSKVFVVSLLWKGAIALSSCLQF